MREPIYDIVLIGSIGAGKTTLGRRIAETLGRPQVSLDALCRDYYRELGELQNGPDGMIAGRFNVHAVERMLQDHRNCIFDLGAGHSVYREEEALTHVQKALACYPNVFLLLPSPDREESSQVLRERNAGNPWLAEFSASHGYDPNEHFLRHPSNFTLAKKIIYTNGKTIEQSRDEILSAAVS